MVLHWPADQVHHDTAINSRSLVVSFRFGGFEVDISLDGFFSKGIHFEALEGGQCQNLWDRQRELGLT